MKSTKKCARQYREWIFSMWVKCFYLPWTWCPQSQTALDTKCGDDDIQAIMSVNLTIEVILRNCFDKTSHKCPILNREYTWHGKRESNSKRVSIEVRFSSQLSAPRFPGIRLHKTVCFLVMPEFEYKRQLASNAFKRCHSVKVLELVFCAINVNFCQTITTVMRWRKRWSCLTSSTGNMSGALFFM